MLTHNNQTAKADVGKPRLTLVPTGIIKAVEKVRRYGNEKYHDPHCPLIDLSQYEDDGK